MSAVRREDSPNGKWTSLTFFVDPSEQLRLRGGAHQTLNWSS